MTGAPIRRAIWGLVNDGYGLVARTDSLTHDEAYELCRTPDMGDPTGFVESSLAFLHVPRWGFVCARYFTNAEPDSSGRLSLVYDVVAIAPAALQALRNDPFAVFPPLTADRRPERFGALDAPAPATRDERARLGELLATVDRAALAPLLAGTFAGERALWVGSGISASLVECAVLLLPPSLRTALTFQTLTVDPPKHAPRLTVADRMHAALAEREWTATLPRDAGDARLAEGMSLAERVVALGEDPERLAAAHAAYEAFAAASSRRQSVALGTEVGRLLRFDALVAGIRAGDLRRAVLAAARAADPAEGAAHAAALLARATPEALAESLGDVVRGGQRGSWTAARALGSVVVAEREREPDRFARFFRSLIAQLRDEQPPADEPAAGATRAMLAGAAAALDDLESVVALADGPVDLPWSEATKALGDARAAGRSIAARLVLALARLAHTPEPAAVEVLDALAQGSASLRSAPARALGASLALGVVRRALRTGTWSEAPDRPAVLVDALTRVWAQLPPTSDDGETLRRLVERPGTGDARRLASDLTRTVYPTGAGSTPGDMELLGWSLAVAERVRLGVLADAALAAIGAVLGEGRTAVVSGAELAARLGRGLVRLAGNDVSFVFRPGWQPLIAALDRDARRDLFGRALAWVVREYAAGRFTVGAIADACATLGAAGMHLDEGAVSLVAPHLARVGETRSAVELGIIASALAEVATPDALARLTDQLLARAPERTADLVRLRRLAVGLDEVERVRDEEAVGAWRLRLRRALQAKLALSPDAEQRLREFLGVREGSLTDRLVAKLPRVADGPGRGRPSNGSSRGAR
jgi:hypothetical protein